MRENDKDKRKNEEIMTSSRMYKHRGKYMHVNEL
jgi:hypothetical protein